MDETADLDMEFVKMGMEMLEQEKADLQSHIYQLEAELLAIKRLIIPQYMQESRVVSGPYLDYPVENLRIYSDGKRKKFIEKNSALSTSQSEDKTESYAHKKKSISPQKHLLSNSETLQGKCDSDTEEGRLFNFEKLKGYEEKMCHITEPLSPSMSSPDSEIAEVLHCPPCEKFKSKTIPYNEGTTISSELEDFLTDSDMATSHNGTAQKLMMETDTDAHDVEENLNSPEAVIRNTQKENLFSNKQDAAQNRDANVLVPTAEKDCWKTNLNLPTFEKRKTNVDVDSPESCIDSLMEETAQPLVDLRNSSTYDEKCSPKLSKDEVDVNFTAEKEEKLVSLEKSFIKDMPNEVDPSGRDLTFTDPAADNCTHSSFVNCCKKTLNFKSSKRHSGKCLTRHGSLKPARTRIMLSKKASFLQKCPPKAVRQMSTKSQTALTNSTLDALDENYSNKTEKIISLSPTTLSTKKYLRTSQSVSRPFSQGKVNKTSQFVPVFPHGHNAEVSDWSDISVTKNVGFEKCERQELTLSERSRALLHRCKSLRIVVKDCSHSNLKQDSNSLLENTDVMSLPDLDDSLFESMHEETCTTLRYPKPPMKLFQKTKIRKLPDTIPGAVVHTLRSLETVVFGEDNFEFHVKALTDVLSDQANASKSSDVIFYILKYLSVTNKNPILHFGKTRNPSVLQRPLEDCIVSALINIDANSKLEHESFLLSVVINIRQIVLAMDTIVYEGLCALCRVFTKICKSKGNKREPILLCCDILKKRHKFGTILIASIASVWKELFDVRYDAPEEEVIFHGALKKGAMQWPQAVPSAVAKAGLTQAQWEISKRVVEMYMPASCKFPVKETLDFLIKSIEEKCIRAPCEEEFMLTNSVAMLAAFKSWSRSKEDIVDKYLVPRIGEYAGSKRCERGLALFCKLYAEICFIYPNLYEAEKLLIDLFEAGGDLEEDKFIQDAAALPLIQLLFSKKKPLPDNLKEWMEKNEDNPKFLNLKLLRHRRTLADKIYFTEEDIL